MLYFLVHQIFPDFAIKNLIFFIIWPALILGTIRANLVLLITFDRCLAANFPIFHHNYRSKIPIILIISIFLIYTIFEHFVLFGFCDFTLNVPINCDTLICSVNLCYYNYWLLYEQLIYVLIGFFTISLGFRLFVWNNFMETAATNHVISKATRIALLDSIIICFFDIIPTISLAHFPALSFPNVGPLSAVSKNSGFLIEGIIICFFLFRKPKTTSVQAWSSSRISRSY
ncbi:Protein CBG24410 [Caenorhabditis briggsae]|uniref:Protein CBG24410 n=1 Tax=Caenorhabditis briggsae TaxID=6238 RepID=A8WKN2_CAEBR|nr:Protein CBG24410 [Caenorhabditis briggsae]CAP21027.2 Protein CBG24410 [Caenorhabditis briggsae]